jgi:hypothetical protein
MKIGEKRPLKHTPALQPSGPAADLRGFFHGLCSFFEKPELPYFTARVPILTGKIFLDENSNKPARQRRKGPVSFDPTRCQQLKYTEGTQKRRLLLLLSTRPF